MADLYNSDLGGNTRKVTPSSLFGTREIKWLQMNFDYDVYTDNAPWPDGYTYPDSLYSYTVRCIQEVAELYYLGAPTRQSSNSFVFGIATDTAEWEHGFLGYNHPVTPPNRPQGINELIDRLVNALGEPDWWILQELEDCGFGLMPGNHLADPNSY